MPVRDPWNKHLNNPGGGMNKPNRRPNGGVGRGPGKPPGGVAAPKPIQMPEGFVPWLTANTKIGPKKFQTLGNKNKQNLRNRFNSQQAADAVVTPGEYDISYQSTPEGKLAKYQQHLGSLGFQPNGQDLFGQWLNGAGYEAMLNQFNVHRANKANENVLFSDYLGGFDRNTIMGMYHAIPFAERGLQYNAFDGLGRWLAYG
jgi:hypothetical protein